MKKYFWTRFFLLSELCLQTPKNCSEYSGKLKHASAVDSVSKLSLKMDGKPMNFSWKSCFMSYPNQAFSCKIKVTVTIFGQSCLIEKITALFSVTQSTSSLFYSKRMYQETYGKLFSTPKTNATFPRRRVYFFVIIFLEFPVRTYLRREITALQYGRKAWSSLLSATSCTIALVKTY